MSILRPTKRELAELRGYYGGMQFLLSTWVHVGGRGLPSVATPREQLFRAYLVYRRDGSWSEWRNTARGCGLR